MAFFKQIARFGCVLGIVAIGIGCVQRTAPVERTPTMAVQTSTPESIGAMIPVRVSYYPDNYDALYTRLVEEEISIFEIQQDVQNGCYSYEDLTRFYIDRIEECENVHAILSILPNAILRAQDCDKNPGAGSPLYGIPVILTDSIDAAGAASTSGAYLLRARVPEKDAFCLQMLEVAGAIPIAKANLDELNGFVIHYNDGKARHGSALGGEPVSPYGNERDVGGSDFGCAMAVTLNLAPLAIGTDTLGSVLSPAYCNSIVGIRPSHALVSRTGLIPGCVSYDVAGPMAKTVMEAACALYAMQGSDVEDPFQSSYQPIDDPLEFLPMAGEGALIDKRIYIGTGADLLPDGVKIALETAGATLVTGLSYEPYQDDPTMQKLGSVPYQYGVRDSINVFLSTAAVEGVTSVPLLVSYNEKHAAEAIPYGQSHLLHLALLAPMTYETVDTVDQYLRVHSIDSFMAKNNLNLILSSNASITAYGDTPLNPSVSLPMGQREIDGKTSFVSAVLTARLNEDETAITAAYVLEMLLGSNRVKP
ncbi:MAG: amidase family protein [Clostridia bacterium]